MNKSVIIPKLRLNSDGTSEKCDLAEWRVRIHNASKGELVGYDCDKCNNRGIYMYIKDGYEYMGFCECMKVRRSKGLLKKSGVEKLAKRYTFDNFTTADAWQKQAKDMAQAYAGDPGENWFYAGGQPGSGKTHLCTAITEALIRKGMPAHYMLWRDEVVKLKAAITDDSEYSLAMSKLKETEVLYIDDFFKTERGKIPSAAEINIAFELLNYRYNNDLITILSSEKLLEEIIDIDEATGSRIYQKAKDFYFAVDLDRKKNYRIAYTAS